jgi:hypothetical protein
MVALRSIAFRAVSGGVSEGRTQHGPSRVVERVFVERAVECVCWESTQG